MATNVPPPRDALRELLRKRVLAAGDDAVRADGEVSGERVDALERLSRLADLSSAVAPPRVNRIPIVVALAGTLALVSVLLFARVNQTEIALDATVSGVTFAAPSPVVLTEAVTVASFGATGLGEVQLPRTRQRSERTLRATDTERPALKLSTIPGGPDGGAVTLEPLTLPAGTRVGLRIAPGPNQLHVSLRGGGIVVRVGMTGRTRLMLSGAAPEETDFPVPATVSLTPGSSQLDLDLTFPAAPTRLFVSQLSAADVSFSEVEQFFDPSVTLVREVSTILSGAIYFESLNGDARPLRARETLHLDGASGEIRTLTLGDGRIALGFQGHVRGLARGDGDNARSLMPTYLDWLKARHSLSLIWGTTLYIFGLVLGVLRWWGYKL